MLRNASNPVTFENLETRQLCSASSLQIAFANTHMGLALVVNGSNKSDTITVSQSSRGVTVSDSHGSTTIGKRVSLIEINAGLGNDTVNVSRSVKLATMISGGAGNDTLNGGTGRDSINGGAGADKIYGNAGNDLLIGGAGNDSIYGGAGKDYMAGSAGDDTIIAIGGNTGDSMEGDDGFDSLWLDDASNEVVTDQQSTLEQMEGSIHRVDGFMNFTDTNGNEIETPTELNGQDLEDPYLDSNPDGTANADGYANFAGLPLFNNNTPKRDDINQGAIGDCYFLSTLAAVANNDPLLIKQSVTDLGDGTFGVRFISDSGESTFVRVDADMPVNAMKDGSLNLAYAQMGSGAAMWVPVMEKAFAFFRQAANRTDNDQATSYHALNGGFLDEAPRALGAANVVNSEWKTNPFVDGYEMLGWISGELNAGKIVTFATGEACCNNLITLHAYTVVGVTQGADGECYLQLRNPWGVDGKDTGDGHDDGYVFIRACDAFNSMSQVQSSWV